MELRLINGNIYKYEKNVCKGRATQRQEQVFSIIDKLKILKEDLLRNGVTAHAHELADLILTETEKLSKLPTVVAPAATKSLEDSLIERKISPIEFREIEKATIESQKETIRETFAPAAITPDVIIEKRNTDKSVTWDEIKSSEKYNTHKKLKNFLGSFPSEVKAAPTQTRQTAGWGMSDEAEKINQEKRKRNGQVS